MDWGEGLEGCSIYLRCVVVVSLKLEGSSFYFVIPLLYGNILNFI